MSTFLRRPSKHPENVVHWSSPPLHMDVLPCLPDLWNSFIKIVIWILLSAWSLVTIFNKCVVFCYKTQDCCSIPIRHTLSSLRKKHDWFLGIFLVNRPGGLGLNQDVVFFGIPKDNLCVHPKNNCSLIFETKKFLVFIAFYQGVSDLSPVWRKRHLHSISP